MKKATLIILAATIGMALAPVAEAQQAGGRGARQARNAGGGRTAAVAKVAALAEKCKNGNGAVCPREVAAALTAAVASLLTAYPDAVGEIATIEQSAGPAAQTAIVAGIAQAIKTLTATGNSNGVATITAALANDPTLASAVASAETAPGNEGGGARGNPGGSSPSPGVFTGQQNNQGNNNNNQGNNNQGCNPAVVSCS
jgi:hypothetical protein